MKKDDMEKLIKMREEALDYRLKAEEEVLQSMFSSKKLSERNYNIKIKRLTKWIEKEKNKIILLK
jgi:hypothetical protein